MIYIYIYIFGSIKSAWAMPDSWILHQNTAIPFHEGTISFSLPETMYYIYYAIMFHTDVTPLHMETTR